MFLKRLIVCACALGLFVSGASGVPFHNLPPDVNADGKSDVLDIQVVTAAVVAGETRRACDVNGDGSVDVRDFQRAVTQVGQSLPQAPAPPRVPAAETTVSEADDFVPAVRQVQAACDPCIGEGQPRHDAFRHMPKVAGLKTAALRYLFHLTANSQPSCFS